MLMTQRHKVTKIVININKYIVHTKRENWVVKTEDKFHASWLKLCACVCLLLLAGYLHLEKNTGMKTLVDQNSAEHCKN